MSLIKSINMVAKINIHDNNYNIFPEMSVITSPTYQISSRIILLYISLLSISELYIMLWDNHLQHAVELLLILTLLGGKLAKCL